MFGRLILLFVTVPLLELLLLLEVGKWIGVLPTVGLVVTTGILGAALARQQGVRAFLAVQKELATGRLPGTSLVSGLAVLIGGALLLTPGILTDFVGFGLLFPPTREWALRRAIASWERRLAEGTIQVSVMGQHPFMGQRPPFGQEEDVVPGRTEVHVRRPD